MQRSADMLNLRHIEVFHAVCSSGSISAAARALNVAQPSMSKVLRHAETRVGFALFNRTAGRLTPTDEARALLVEVDDSTARSDLLDMTRTVPSACANLAVTTTVARLEGELADSANSAGDRPRTLSQ